MAAMMPTGEDLKRKTEEELLASDNLSEEERRRIKRRASNRESARRTRYKRTEKLKELEDKKAVIAEENAKIVNQIHELEKIYWDALLENRQLKSEIQILRAAKPQLSALCPSSLGTVFNTSQPLNADFMSMSLPHGTVPPAPPLSLNSDIAGMPNPHMPSSLAEFHAMPGMANPPASLLSLPPPAPLSTHLPGGVPAAAAPPAAEGSELVNNAPLPINFTSMLEGMDADGSIPASSVQAALAQFYATSGLSQPAIPAAPAAKGKDGQLLGEVPSGLMLPPADAAHSFDHYAAVPGAGPPLVPALAPSSMAPSVIKAEDLPEPMQPTAPSQPLPEPQSVAP